MTPNDIALLGAGLADLAYRGAEPARWFANRECGDAMLVAIAPTEAEATALADSTVERLRTGTRAAARPRLEVVR